MAIVNNHKEKESQKTDNAVPEPATDCSSKLYTNITQRREVGQADRSGGLREDHDTSKEE